MIGIVISVLLAGTSALQTSDSLGADWSPKTGGVRALKQAGRIIPLSQAIHAVEARTPGHLLDAGLETGADGRSVYRVRWAASDGRRLDVIVDAETGAILRQEGK